MAETLEVLVVVAPAPGETEQCREVTLRLQRGATVVDALDASGLSGAADVAVAKIGIWGKLVPRDRVLAAHDRVEIYRPLRVDPKVARARRATKKKASGRR